MNIVVTVNATLGKRVRNTRQWFGWVGWLLRLVGLGFVVGGVLGALPFYLVGLGVFAVYPELLGAIGHLRARKFGSRYTYTLRDEGIGVKSAITALEISWTGVKSVQETAAEWLLRITGGGLIGLPKTAISLEDDATFRAFLANRALIRS